jgi:hypothetical protein
MYIRPFEHTLFVEDDTVCKKSKEKKRKKPKIGEALGIEHGTSGLWPIRLTTMIVK